MNLGTITGTTGSTFPVVSASSTGKIGVRNIGGTSFRIRVQPATGAKLVFPSGWKTPSDGQNRFSFVVSDAISLAGAVSVAQKALDQAAVDAAGGLTVTKVITVTEALSL